MVVFYESLSDNTLLSILDALNNSSFDLQFFQFFQSLFQDFGDRPKPYNLPLWFFSVLSIFCIDIISTYGIIIMIFTLCEFLTPILTGNFSLRDWKSPRVSRILADFHNAVI